MMEPLGTDRYSVHGEPAFPASFAQERLWFLHHLEGGDRAYNVYLALRLRGRLDPEVLRASLEEIVRRHDVLRTRFPLHDGRPVQFVAPMESMRLPTIDLRSLPESARSEEAARLAREDVEDPVDLVVGPPIRARMFRIAEEEHVLLVTLHHIVADGWSLGVFLREFAAIYAAFGRGEASPLPEPPIQYADYAIWQRNRFDRGTFEPQLAYWTRQLGGAPALLELPTDHKRPSIQSFRGASESFVLSRETLDGLQNLSRVEGATLFMTLAACFQVLLSRLSGQEDVLVGTPVAGRTRLETEDSIGLFVNTLVLRGKVSDDPGFREFLRSLRDTAIEAYDRQEIPFEKLVEQLHPARTLSYSPIFQVMFELGTTGEKPPPLADLSIKQFPLRGGIAKFDLTLEMQERSDSLTGTFEYNADLFEPATIRRWVRHFRTLLDGILANPDRRVSQLPLLPDAERLQILREGNETAVPYPSDRCIHGLFEEQAERSPDAPAVESAGAVLTYAELNARANRLAHRLRAVGVEPEVRVGLCLPRSIDLTVALLGILKAGGTCVPFDPAHPPARLRWLAEDAEASLVVIDAELAETFGSSGARLLRLDREAPLLAAESDENLERQPSPENTACLIYTSGSTGAPKGVLITHRNLVHHSTAIAARYGLRREDRVLQFASIAFDVAAEELFPTWFRGGCVVLGPRSLFDETTSLEERIERERLTVVNLPASLWREWTLGLERRESQVPAGLHLVVVGSEVVSPQAWAVWRRRVGNDVRIINAYGPTETTITATTYESEAVGETDGLASIPIGRPIANVRAYVLDRHRQPVPPGVVGELFIGGEGVTRGYWRRPAETEERFFPDPLVPSSRMYRTGDRARTRPDGNLEFGGRLDRQLKIRGFRVEPAEIEHVLSSHPGVREAAVAAVEQSPGDSRLIGYIVPAQPEGVSPRELRTFLRERLPDAFVPAAFAFIDALPRTPAGKLDRGALPASAAILLLPERKFVAPSDSLERQLARIWESVLPTRPIGVTDDFFELGGHSLLAVKLFSEIENLVGKKLPLATLFQAPTIQEIARILREQGWMQPWSSLVPIQPGGSKPPFYCVHAAGGNVLTYRDLARYLGPDQPVYGLQAQGLDGKQPRHARVEEMAAHYVREIRNFQPQGPYYLGGVSFGGTVAYEIAQQLRAEGEAIGLLALFDTYGPGYPRRLPGTSLRRRRLYRFYQRIDLHVGNLLAGDMRQKKEYLREKRNRLASRLRQRWRRFRRRLTLPRELRAVDDASKRALFKYVPRPYAGRVTLFRATKQPAGVYPDPTLGWASLALGGVEIQEIPGYHGAVVYEPRVGALARELTRRLEAARAESEGPSASQRAEATRPARVSSSPP